MNKLTYSLCAALWMATLAPVPATTQVSLSGTCYLMNRAPDDRVYYAALKAITSEKTQPTMKQVVVPSSSYFPSPESQRGWRKLESADDIRRLGGMDPRRLDELRVRLLQSDKRNFAATVSRHPDRRDLLTEISYIESPQTVLRTLKAGYYE